MNTTGQQIFNRVWLHLLCQRRRSLSGDPVCQIALYGRGGRRDAIGCLISRDNYSPDLEDRTASDSKVLDAVAKTMGCSIAAVDAVMLSKLRRIHDLEPVAAWEEMLTKLAIERGLNTPKMPRKWSKGMLYRWATCKTRTASIIPDHSCCNSVALKIFMQPERLDSAGLRCLGVRYE